MLQNRYEENAIRGFATPISAVYKDKQDEDVSFLNNPGVSMKGRYAKQANLDCLVDESKARQLKEESKPQPKVKKAKPAKKTFFSNLNSKDHDMRSNMISSTDSKNQLTDEEVNSWD